MREYTDDRFGKILAQIRDDNHSVIRISFTEEELICLKYSLLRHSYYAVIIDEYPHNIEDKSSFLEAIYYQARLITLHDLNWDAFEEALYDAVRIYSEFDGICLLFKDKNLSTKLSDEFEVLVDIISNINKHVDKCKLSLLINA